MAETNTGKKLEHGLEDCEQVAEAIKAVGAAATRVIAGPLSMRAICVLIRDGLPRGSKMDVGDIQNVLECAAALARRHVINRKA